jgi:hypothetical protein
MQDSHWFISRPAMPFCSNFAHIRKISDDNRRDLSAVLNPGREVLANMDNMATEERICRLLKHDFDKSRFLQGACFAFLRVLKGNPRQFLMAFDLKRQSER